MSPSHARIKDILKALPPHFSRKSIVLAILIMHSLSLLSTMCRLSRLKCVQFVLLPSKRNLLLYLLLFFPEVYAQIPASQGQNRPVIIAQGINQAPSIDGRLDEAVWIGRFFGWLS